MTVSSGVTSRARQRRRPRLADAIEREERYAGIGFELKISRSDWLRELKPWNRDKATPVKQFCDRWCVVCANSKIVKYADELPEGWGLIFAEDRKLVTFIEAPKLEPLALNRAFVAALMRRATRIDGLAHLVPPNNDWSKKNVAA